MRSAWSAVILLVCVALVAPVAKAAPPGDDAKRLHDASVAVHQLDLEQAAPVLRELAQRYPGDADVQEAVALLEFYEGHYGDAVTQMTAASGNASGPALEQRKGWLGIFTATRDATAGFVEASSADGRFRVRHAPGTDAVLVPYALAAMARADAAITDVLGYTHPGPIRLEIYATPADLAKVSSLTVEEIERTGTIALCKWDRLMVTSPRALVRGYPWVDTIGHEYVHLLLARATRDKAPVWFQEGVARFLEDRWRGFRALRLDPAAQALLESAVKENRLIPFDKLHPSIARLPSQEDAALAFAQVATFISQFVAVAGEEGLRQAVHRIALGSDAREAVAAVLGTTWNTAEDAWKGKLRAEPAATTKAPTPLSLRFRRGDGVVDESQDVRVEGARRHLRLGDLLWNHGRAAAAASEYEKAHGLAPDDPILASRLARAALEGGKPAAAVAALLPLRERYPEHAPLHSLLGTAYADLGKVNEARTELYEAIWINPFDPEPHCGLSRIETDAATKARETLACNALHP